ncbi:MAG: cation:proton antiporter [Gammaproteobacteria bacterium]|nr:cation:proton antiporter [Gammaproteobacteria bacterium]
MYETLAIFSIFIFIYSLLSGRLERTPINGAIVFAAFGLALGSYGLGILNLDLNSESLSTLAELTLALVLFTDASNANLSVLKKNASIHWRLLLIGLPLTILLGFVIGVLIFDSLTLFEVAILATLLAPTDAALGKAVVTNPAVPDKIREGLNVESGLNDGICVPIIYLFLALAAGNAGDNPHILALELVSKEIGIGVIVGLSLTFVATLFMKYCNTHHWATKTWEQLPIVVLAISCFAIAQILGGSGFIAAFVGGILLSSIKTTDRFLLAAEGTGDTLALITWVVFGAIVVGHSLHAFTWQIIVYSLLSLTVIRMLPAYLSLAGLNLRSDEKLFIGWFGPRGLASVVFAIMVINANLPGSHTIVLTAVCTITLSIILHGLSANSFIKLLASRIKSDTLETQKQFSKRVNE